MIWINFISIIISVLLIIILVLLLFGIMGRNNENPPLLGTLVFSSAYGITYLFLLIALSSYRDIYISWIVDQPELLIRLLLAFYLFASYFNLLFSISKKDNSTAFLKFLYFPFALQVIFSTLLFMMPQAFSPALTPNAGIQFQGYWVTWGISLIGMLNYGVALVAVLKNWKQEEYPFYRLSLSGLMIGFINPSMYVMPIVMLLSFSYHFYHVFWIQLTKRIIQQIDTLKFEVERRKLAEETVTVLNEELRHAYISTLEGWARALELRDKETEGHSRRVTELSFELARKYGLPDEELIHFRHGALLHDIGKMGIPDEILNKPNQLTIEEREIIERHPEIAIDMLKDIDFLSQALVIPYSHHEKWDGSGYPNQLKGNEIPLYARIFTVVDVWDALTSDRKYSKAWSHKEALDYIKENSGVFFDPDILEIFLELMS